MPYHGGYDSWDADPYEAQQKAEAEAKRKKAAADKKKKAAQRAEDLRREAEGEESRQREYEAKETQRLADVETQRLADVETQRLADVETQRLADVETQRLEVIATEKVLAEEQAWIDSQKAQADLLAQAAETAKAERIAQAEAATEVQRLADVEAEEKQFLADERLAQELVDRATAKDLQDAKDAQSAQATWEAEQLAAADAALEADMQANAARDLDRAQAALEVKNESKLQQDMGQKKLGRSTSAVPSDEELSALTGEDDPFTKVQPKTEEETEEEPETEPEEEPEDGPLSPEDLAQQRDVKKAVDAKKATGEIKPDKKPEPDKPADLYQEDPTDDGLEPWQRAGPNQDISGVTSEYVDESPFVDKADPSVDIYDDSLPADSAWKDPLDTSDGDDDTDGGGGSTGLSDEELKEQKKVERKLERRKQSEEHEESQKGGEKGLSDEDLEEQKEILKEIKPDLPSQPPPAPTPKPPTEDGGDTGGGGDGSAGPPGDGSTVTAPSDSVIAIVDTVAKTMRPDGRKPTTAAIERKYQEEQRIIDEQNLMRKKEQARAFGQKQANSYRLSVSQGLDAYHKANEFNLLAQDFLNESGVIRGKQSVAYSRSGALMAGSALARTKQTKEEGERGAARLRMAAENTRKRGKMLSKITRESPVKPAFIPIPDAIREPYIPKRPVRASLTVWSNPRKGGQKGAAKQIYSGPGQHDAIKPGSDVGFESQVDIMAPAGKLKPASELASSIQDVNDQIVP